MKRTWIAIVVVALATMACNISEYGFTYEPTQVAYPTATSPAPGAQSTPPAAACREQMFGPFQPPSTKAYWYVQINSEFVDADYLVSLWWQKGINLNQGLIQQGNGSATEVVFLVRTSIKEVQFANPAGGVAWRLCGHSNTQLAQELEQHAHDIASARSWLRVYNVQDLWVALQAGDTELNKLIKCITPLMQGITDCHDVGATATP